MAETSFKVKGWKRHYDDSNGAYYFENEKGDTTWDDPRDDDSTQVESGATYSNPMLESTNEARRETSEQESYSNPMHGNKKRNDKDGNSYFNPMREEKSSSS